MISANKITKTDPLQFFKDFLLFLNEIESSKVEYFKHHLDKLFSIAQISKNWYANYNKIAAEDFNVFSILKLERNETRVHSPILKNLLDPQGTHGQEDLFYQLFIDCIVRKNKLFDRNKFINSFTSDYFITLEKYTGEDGDRGFIDIMIRSMNPNKPFVVIIENKIDAADQKDQIDRYFRYAISLGYTSSQIIIIYLTVLGNEPSFYSHKKEKSDLEIILMSYKNDLFNWLLQSIPLIASDKVKYIVLQYTEILKQL